MSHFKIKEPWWKKNAVGLAERDMTEEVLTVEILYKDKNGKRLYPDPLYIRRNKAMMCQKDKVRKTGLPLRIVPIDQLSKEKPDA